MLGDLMGAKTGWVRRMWSSGTTPWSAPKPHPIPIPQLTDFWASSKVFSMAVIWLSLSLYISSSVNCCFTETPILGVKRKAFRGHWTHLKSPLSLPTHHNLLDLRLLIGDAITIELSGDVLSLPHPRHHLRVLLGSGGRVLGTWDPPPSSHHRSPPPISSSHSAHSHLLELVGA